MTPASTSEQPNFSQHYAGAAGAAYDEYQSRFEAGLATVNSQRFWPHIAPTDTVLDFGCGSGELLSRLGGARKIGIEINVDSRARAAARGIETYASTAQAGAQVADVVISSHALEHTLEPLTELRLLREALKPQGKLVMLLPINDWRNERHEDLTDPNHHLYGWTPLLIGNLLTEAGFSDISAEVWTYAILRGQVRLLWDRIPRAAFDLTARFAAMFRRRRHIFVVAYRGDIA